MKQEDKFDVICDVDGTIVNVKKRHALAKAGAKKGKKLNWEIFLDDEVILENDVEQEDVTGVIKSLIESGHRVIITSARNERHRKVTEQQLANFGIKHSALFLRADGDFRGDDDVKEELLGKIREAGFDPKVAFDDRQKVVDRWRKIGIQCHQVRFTDV